MERKKKRGFTIFFLDFVCLCSSVFLKFL
jgi:hypothetical protein